MKKTFTLIITTLTFYVALQAQIVSNRSFTTYYPKTETLYEELFIETGEHILPLSLNQSISGFSVSGHITFTGEMGFVRIVLTDNFDNDYLVLETNTIFENETTLSFNEFCEETALLDNILPKQLMIECTDAEVTIYEMQYSIEDNFEVRNYHQIKENQLYAKLQHINTVLTQKEITWGAGKTSLAEMSYMQKKSLFGGKLPNLAGFDYYAGGIYVTQGYNAANNPPSKDSFVAEFDWRNRHGRNWITSVKSQGCQDCWAFSTVGVTEAYVNLYYNQLLNLDLSEQDILSCSNAGNCSGGKVKFALEYIQNTGVVDENCFEYKGSHLPCSNKCTDPTNKINIDTVVTFYNSTNTIDDFKRLIMKSPTTFGLVSTFRGHSLMAIGFRTLQVGDSIWKYDGQQNSWILTRIIHREANLQFQSRHGVLVGYIFKNSV